MIPIVQMLVEWIQMTVCVLVQLQDVESIKYLVEGNLRSWQATLSYSECANVQAAISADSTQQSALLCLESSQVTWHLD